MLETAETDVMTRVTARVAEKVHRLTEQAVHRTHRVEDGGRFDKKSEWSNWTVVALLVLCFFVLVRFRPFAGGEGGQSGPGNTLSALELESLDKDGRPVALADLAGRVVLLHFWQPWSELSHETLPKLAAVEETFRTEGGFRFLAISCDHNTPEPVVLRQQTDSALAKLQVRLPAYADPKRVTHEAIDRAVGLRSYPATVIIDRRGRIRQVWRGVQPDADEEMRKLVTKLLQEN